MCKAHPVPVGDSTLGYEMADPDLPTSRFLTHLCLSLSACKLEVKSYVQL